jgi:hypothetical protein
MKWAGNLAILGGVFAAAIHYVRFGRKQIGLEASGPDVNDRAEDQ